MRAIHKVLFPTDFSAGADPAMELAIEMAKKFGADLTLLHVYPAPIVFGAYGDIYPMPADVFDKLRHDAERALAELKLRVAKSHLKIETLAMEGVAADVILAVAGGRAIDLIVMGTHGRTGLRHLMLGSVAERVVRTAACPVMTVRASEEGKSGD